MGLEIYTHDILHVAFLLCLEVIAASVSGTHAGIHGLNTARTFLFTNLLGLSCQSEMILRLTKHLGAVAITRQWLSHHYPLVGGFSSDHPLITYHYYSGLSHH